MNSSAVVTSIPVNYGPQLNAIVWAFTGLSATFLSLRIYSKLLRQRHLRCDDLVLTAGWVALAISSALLSVSITYGMGRNNDSINKQTFDRLVFFQIASGSATIVATGLSKSSFAMTLLSIMPVISDTEGRQTRMLVWFVLISINVVLGALGTLQWVQCWPPERIWNPDIPGTCQLQGEATRKFGTFASAYSGSADIVLALIPWKIIYGAKIRRKEKMGALFAMSMGVFAGITCLLKITTLYAIGNPDMLTLTNLFILGTTEAAITIMATSIPMMRPLFSSPLKMESG